MNEPEAFRLLTLASARDNRSVSQSVAMVWAADLARVSITDATAALTLHYQERPDVWLQPGHVITGARRVQALRERDERVNGPRAIEPRHITLDRDDFERLTLQAIEAHRAEKEQANESN
ncbi:hypothetical protein E3T54_02845 [Cryobacterium sp. Sr8]|uniref:hypothetical protein n=1 Tax=Cryobacterium sp. Sr8 TaxID=1259203 RepID=UPI00106A44F6|nr:hypothetical protein [Cryobacterium sp. Sr8]TFD80696.1 hypothetical protein E3T54_02845 [Cryobacterium sp. Sr8]